VGVLLIDGEMDLADLRARMVALSPTKPEAAFDVLSHQHVFAVEQTDMNFGVRLWQERLMTYLAGRPDIRVVIFDNLSCLLPTTPEDKRDDWARDVLPFLISLRRRGVAAILVHHSGKQGQQRGSSAREDQLDTTIRLDPLPDADTNAGARFTVRFTKSRGSFGVVVEPIEAGLLAQSDCTLTWTWKALAESTTDRLLALVHDGGSMTIREAADALGVSPAAIHKAKKKLIAEAKLKAGAKLEAADDWA
jgi:hypothetical protein